MSASMVGRHRITVLLAVMVVGLAAIGAGTMTVAASNPAPTAAQQSDDPATQATLTGIVLDPDGQPVSNTQVAITSDSGSFGELVQTDAEGQFSLSGLDPATRTLVASAAGYGNSDPITVALGTNSTDRVFQLTAADEGRLQGTVTTAAGEPLEAGTVVAFQSSALQSSRSVQLGADGQYELTALPTGEYTMTITTANRSGVATVSVDGSGPTTQDFPLAAGGTNVLTGHVRNETGDPLPAGTWVRFEADNGFGPPRTVALGEDGQYALTDLPTDGKSYNLRVTADGIGSTTTIVSVPSGADTQRDFTLSAATPLSIESLEAPSQTITDSEATASVTVSNPGSTTVTESVQYRFDGRPVDTTVVTVGPGTTRTLSIALTPTTAGSFTHGVFTDRDAAFTEIEVTSTGSSGGSDGGEEGGDTGSSDGGSDGGSSGGAVGGISLPPVGEDPSDADPGADDSPDEDDSGDEEPVTIPQPPADDTSDSQTDEQGPDEADSEASTTQDQSSEGDSGQPGFGVLATLCALLTGAGLLRRRR